VQPDLFAFRMEQPGPVREWSEIRAIELAVEVLSTSTARFDRVVKRRFFQDVGVPEYWIVDLDARVVERWRPGDARPEICTATLEWRAGESAPPVTVDLVAMFRAALGE
jgi:Uma2 family endonuclease